MISAAETGASKAVKHTYREKPFVRGIGHPRKEKILPTEWLTVLLLLILCILLGEVTAAMPPPDPPSPPGIFTSVAYSTLLSEIQEHLVLAAHLEGETLNGLLVSSPKQAVLFSSSQNRQQAQMNPEVGSFLACLPEVTDGCFDGDENPLFPRTRLIYTLVPEQDMQRLVALLLEKRVVISIVRPSTIPPWVPLIWKYGPFWLLLLFLVGGDWPPAPTKVRW
jgi:hypothetical protein